MSATWEAADHVAQASIQAWPVGWTDSPDLKANFLQTLAVGLLIAMSNHGARPTIGANRYNQNRDTWLG